jgi:hypothetical protein
MPLGDVKRKRRQVAPPVSCVRIARVPRSSALIGLLVVVLLAGLPPAAGAQADPISGWLAAVNATRLRAGAGPCELSPGLSVAAQRHANDLASNMVLSETGADGSTPGQRILAAGYYAWTDAEGAAAVGEAIASSGGGVDEALATLLQDPAYSAVLHDPRYREVGIGVATDVTGRLYSVLDFGARPNVLPVFVNDGAYNTLDRQVAIHLTNEAVRPEGQGVAIGRVIELRISNEPQWDALPWQAWEEFVPWELPDAPGEHTVYVQLRDAAGRTVAAADAIFLGEATPPTRAPVALTPVSTAPAEPATTPAAEGAVAPTPAPAAPAAGTPTPGLALSATPFPTWTPLPTAAPPAAPGRTKLPLSLVAALQAAALLLGLTLILRRGRRPPSADGSDSQAG